MPRTRIVIAGVFACALLGAAGSAVALAETSGAPSVSYAISSGVPVDRASFSAQDLWLLSTIGESGAITKVGERGGISFYEGTDSGGAACFLTGSDPDGGGLSGGCLEGSELDQPLVDMSSVCMDPASGDWRLGRVEGIAADGVSAVGVVDSDGTLYTTPVVGNLYRMATEDMPPGRPCPGFQARAIVALDQNGSEIYSKPL